MRILRLLSLLFACSLAPVVFANSPVLVLTQVGSYEAVLPGSTVGIPVSMANLGNTYASDVLLTIAIPPHATFVGGCPEWAPIEFGNVVCHLGSLGESRFSNSRETVELDFKLDSAVPLGTLSFPVSLSCSNAPDVPTGTAMIQVVALADVSIAMSSPSVVSGGMISENIVTVTNNGPGEALPKVEVRFDNSVPRVEASPDGWTCTTSAPLVDCNATSPFEPGTATFTFSAFAPPSGSMTQTASLSLVNDTNLLDNQATTMTAVTPEDLPPGPAVALTLTAAPDVVHPGDLLTYTAKITNTSGFDAQGVILTWELSGTVVSTTCGVPSNATCFFNTIAAGASQTVTRTIQVGAAPGPQVRAIARVNAPNIPFDPNTDAAALSTPVAVAPTPQADVSVTIDAAPATPHPGDVITLTITATNGGTAAASGVAVNFFLPTSLAFLSASPGCSGTKAIICTAGTLGSGASATFTVTARAGAPGPILTTASVSTTSPESDSGNNSASTTIVVTTPEPARHRAARH